MLTLAPVIMANAAVCMMGVFVDVFTGFGFVGMVVVPGHTHMLGMANDALRVLVIAAAIASMILNAPVITANAAITAMLVLIHIFPGLRAIKVILMTLNEDVFAAAAHAGGNVAFLAALAPMSPVLREITLLAGDGTLRDIAIGVLIACRMRFLHAPVTVAAIGLVIILSGLFIPPHLVFHAGV